MSEVQPGRPETHREPLLWRAIPLRSPPWQQSLLVTAGALVVAMGLRLAVLGVPIGWGTGSTFFPAFIAATLFAGPRWGWGAWVVVMIIGVSSPWNPVYNLPQQGTLALFGDPHAHLGSLGRVRLFDVGGTIASAGLIAGLLVAIARNTRALAQEEPPTPGTPIPNLGVVGLEVGR